MPVVFLVCVFYWSVCCMPISYHLFLQEFPFQSRNKIPVENVRDYLHLRPRTNFFSSLLRLRNATTNAIHKYFQVFLFTRVISVEIESICYHFEYKSLLTLKFIEYFWRKKWDNILTSTQQHNNNNKISTFTGPHILIIFTSL